MLINSESCTVEHDLRLIFIFERKKEGSHNYYRYAEPDSTRRDVSRYVLSSSLHLVVVYTENIRSSPAT